MKKLTTISLIIFFVIVTTIILVGLFSPQTNNQKANINTGINKTVTKIPANTNTPTSSNTITLNMTEIVKHSSSSDCWMLISGKVYDITNYFGSHPGGNSTMSATCGTDATAAYMTKDPYASSSGGYTAHSSRARSLLSQYFIGDLNAVIIN